MKDTETITTESGAVISIEKSILDDTAEIMLRTDGQAKCLLHWGLRRDPFSTWQVPSQSAWPEGSSAFDHSAVRTPFLEREDRSEIVMKIDLSANFHLLDFVLFCPDEGRWDNNHGHNYQVEIPSKGGPASHGSSLGSSGLDHLAGEIIQKEMDRSSWTLMHRFNLCYDLLDRVQINDLEGMALLFVWLRFSAIRQLDWQRNYNTKPRELGHSMDRLTLKLADRYAKAEGEREIIRLIMTTLGRGSDAQQVRDEVLNIMHRHHIKEVSGHFMEEWHQKLHNNTTPDDIVICEAYLEFLRGNGDLHSFYQRLEQGGVTKERLENYERPIRSHPDFIPYLKDALIHDFEHFLGILKDVHAGTDLGIAIKSARRLFDGEMHGLMDFIWSHQNDRDIGLLIENITRSRRRLAGWLGGPPYDLRDLLFLDIALEDFLRTVVERNLGPQLSGDQLVDLTGHLLENLCLSGRDDELQHSSDHWERIVNLQRFQKEWSLHAESVLERIRRAIGSFVDHYQKLLQPKAEFLGSAFHAASWAISLFSEEVLRGRSAFVLSLVLRSLDPILRKSADLGNWQVISRGHGTGEVKVVESLKSVQGRFFEDPIVLIAGDINGDEEIPQGIVAIITPSGIDSLSHLAIRARNDRVLFAVCYGPEILERLKSLSGRLARLNIDNIGDVHFEESSEAEKIEPKRIAQVHADLPQSVFSVYAVPMGDFSEKSVGYKSNKLKKVRGNLPDWIGVPDSAALPFGVFEKVLAEERNRKVAEKYGALSGRIKELKEEKKGEALAELRALVLELAAPDALVTALRKVLDMEQLPWPSDWDGAWTCIKRVWGSKWNERACLSREANGIPHEALIMSVLIQRVVESEYSFVIHTANPFTGARDEVYAEVVPGLGETLAANYPGRALGFTCRKGSGEPQLLSFPSKSIGLYGGGLIFRSDSNGEDLAGYAGAGLYDSFVLPAPGRVSLDYSGEQLVWDATFRKKLLDSISNIGMVVEDAMHHPQDIEGSYSKGRFFVVQTRPQMGTEDE